MAVNVAWEAQAEGVWVAQSDQKGPTIGILGGVHGNEPAGADVVKQMVAAPIAIERGCVVAMLGNPAAVELGKHYIDYNLNRSFLETEVIDPFLLPADSYEYHRSRLLLPYLKACEAVLDLHQHYGPKVPPFIVCERDAMEVALRIGGPVITFGFSKTEPGGSDAFMHSIGRLGLCYELGANHSTFHAQDVKRGHEVAKRFLSAQGIIKSSSKPLFEHPLLIETVAAVMRIDGEYWINPELNTFDTLERGKLVAINGGKKIYAKENQVIIFPDPDARVGEEAFLLGSIVAE